MDVGDLMANREFFQVVNLAVDQNFNLSSDQTVLDISPTAGDLRFNLACSSGLLTWGAQVYVVNAFSKRVFCLGFVLDIDHFVLDIMPGVILDYRTDMQIEFINPNTPLPNQRTSILRFKCSLDVESDDSNYYKRRLDFLDQNMVADVDVTDRYLNFYNVLAQTMVSIPIEVTGSIRVLSSISEFPNQGTSGVYYISMEDQEGYVWSQERGIYLLVSNNYNNIGFINGGESI